MLGDVNADMARYERAIDAYRRFVAVDDRSPRVLYKLALASYNNGQPLAAIEPLRQAVALDDRFSEAHHLLGACLRASRRSDDALRSFRRAVELNPAFATARADLADLCRELGRHREAIEQLEALTALEPARAERRVSVALAYARLGRTDAAVTALSRAAERYPENASIYTAIGRVWLQSAEQRVDRVALMKALEALQPPAARDEASSDTLALYGRALFLAGDTDGAIRTLEQATSRLPVMPDAFVWLAAAAERRGNAQRAAEAIADYEALATVDPANPIADRIRQSLRLQDRLQLGRRRPSLSLSRPPARRGT